LALADMAILRSLAQQGANLGRFKLLISVTAHSIGFDTAVNIATEALDRYLLPLAIAG